MRAIELYQSGKLIEAIQALGDELRNQPADRKRRTFLFELLCFAGEFDRAEKQLNILSGDNKEADLGVVLYRSALHAERLRREMFEKGDFPQAGNGKAPTGTLNGAAFTELTDGDPRIGARLELYAAGAYLWIPFEHITSIETEPPRRLRDLLWIPALVRTGPAFREKELGEVLIPALAPLSFQHADGGVRLGRATVWEETAGGQAVPFGQKVLLMDGEEVPLLEIRKIEFASAPDDSAAEE
jgi:type VI secretion system protein ImpE